MSDTKTIPAVSSPAEERPAPSRVERLASVLSRWMGPPGPLTLLMALLCAAPVPLVMALAPDLSVNYTQHDIFIPLDAAWRTLQGQWPHSDYYSPLGISYAWLHGAAAWLWGMDGRVVIRANLLALPIVLIPALVVAWSRLNAFSTVVLCALLAVLVTAPTFLDGPVRVIADLADYNRIGAAVCAVTCVWALSPPRPGRSVPAVDAALLGLLMLVLLYLKLTFFLLALVVTVAGCLAAPRFWRQAAAAVAVAAVGAVALEVTHPGLLAGYLADVRRAGASAGQVMRAYYAPTAVVDNLDVCLVIAVLAGALAWFGRAQGRFVSCILIAAAACVAVATQNFGAFSAPLVVLVMVLAQRLEVMVLAQRRRVTDPRPVLRTAGAVAVLACAMPFVLTQAEGALYQASLQRWRAAPLATDPASPLADVRWFPNLLDGEFLPTHWTVEEASTWASPPLPAAAATSILQDGLALVQREGLSQRRIANLAFSNPFPVAFRAPSPRGVALWWDQDRTFALARLTPEQVLGDADVVMVPKIWWAHFDTDDLFGVVRGTLQRDFTARESRYWTAWVRR